MKLMSIESFQAAVKDVIRAYLYFTLQHGSVKTFLDPVDYIRKSVRRKAVEVFALYSKSGLSYATIQRVSRS